MLKTILLPLLLVASLFATAPAHRLGNSLVAAFDGDVNKQHEGGMDIHDVKHKMTTSLNDAIKIVSFDSALDIAAIRQKIDDVLDKARNETAREQMRATRAERDHEKLKEKTNEQKWQRDRSRSRRR